MILSTSSIRISPRWLQAAVLICSMAFLPLAVAHAQDPDYRAVGARLRAAVAAKELTPEQARTMMAVLGKQGPEAGGASRQLTQEDLDRAGREIRKLIGEGRMTPEAGRARLQAMRQRLAPQGKDVAKDPRAAGARAARPAAPKPPETDWVALKKRLGAAVESGRMTREEAAKKFEAMRRQAEAKAKDPRKR